MEPRRVFLADAAATRALGQALAQQWLTQDRSAILALRGDLGAGKTSLVQGLAQGLGIEEPITSPTFALAQHYANAGETRPTLVHLDLYRLEQPAAADELLAQEEEEARRCGALLALEWPERLTALPADAWLVSLELSDANEPEAGRIAQICTGPSPA